ncbi:hypothetical protein CRYUN_Cryun18bG0049900 [Craigia yunnanensis]
MFVEGSNTRASSANLSGSQLVVNMADGSQRPSPPHQATWLAYVSLVNPIFVQALSKKGVFGFMVDFLMGGVSAVVSKIAVALIERVKLLIQNQNEMIKAG